jgi:hypothetical protein
MIGFPLFAAGAPWKSAFLSKATENVFLQLKGQGPFKFSKKYPSSQTLH